MKSKFTVLLVRSGQQEGLSFTTDLVQNVDFSAEIPSKILTTNYPQF
jgi:hypothetical protein